MDIPRLLKPAIEQKLYQGKAIIIYGARRVGKTTLVKTLGQELGEKSFVIFRLTPLSRNPRKEINKMRKIYFYDLGIRNSLIKNFNDLSLRNDVGALWENFCILERTKFHAIHRNLVNRYFWRTYQQQKVDYVEEAGGKFWAFECKWNHGKKKIPKSFLQLYPDATCQIIHRENFFELLK